jgi:hypothetical protein
MSGICLAEDYECCRLEGAVGLPPVDKIEKATKDIFKWRLRSEQVWDMAWIISPY